jgi:hypothetical protein
MKPRSSLHLGPGLTLQLAFTVTFPSPALDTPNRFECSQVDGPVAAPPEAAFLGVLELGMLPLQNPFKCSQCDGCPPLDAFPASPSVRLRQNGMLVLRNDGCPTQLSLRLAARA